MQSRTHNFIFDANFNLATENLLVQKYPSEGTPFPPVEGYFLLLDNTNFLLLNGQNLTLL